MLIRQARARGERDRRAVQARQREGSLPGQERQRQWEVECAASLPARCGQCVASLPQPGQALLRCLVAFLQRVDPEATKMGAQNLGMVFGITVIRRADPLDSMKHNKADTEFMVLLLTHLKP